MKLRSKLALTFGSVFVVSVGASLILTETLSRSSAEFVRLTRESMPTYAHLSRLKSCQDQMRTTVRRGLTDPGYADAERRLEALGAEVRLLYTGVAQLLEARKSLESQDIADLRDAFVELRAAGQEAIEQGKQVLALARKDPTAAQRVYDGAFRPVIERASRLTDLLQAQVGRRVSVQLERVRSAARERARLVGTVVMLILLMLFVVTLSMGRYLAGRIERLRGASDSIARGDLWARVRLGGKDELAALGAAFDSMAEAIERQTLALKRHSSELERGVQERTAQLAARSEQLREKNKALARANEELLGLDAIKNEFVTVISHELRTPLMAIQGALSLLSTGEAGSLDSETQEFVELSQRNTNRLVALVKDLLDLAQLDGGRMRLRPRRVRLGEIADDVLAGFQMMAEEHEVDLRGRVPDSLVIWADPDRTAQILGNLVSNAIKFAPGGSVGIDAKQMDSFVQVSVTDTGMGIPPEALATVFDRFTQVTDTAARQNTGVGLGLAIAKMLVERQGGEIGVSSKLGEGSKFWFTVPLSSAAGRERESPAPAVAATS